MSFRAKRRNLLFTDRRDGSGRADIRLSAAVEPEGGRGKAVIRRQSGGRVRGLDPRTYRPGASGALGGSAPSKGELAVKRPPDTAIPLKADMEPGTDRPDGLERGSKIRIGKDTPQP